MTDYSKWDLVQARLDSSKELYKDACKLFAAGSYKSANNRAYYSLEKAIKALLATEEVDAITHSGVLLQFNRIFIHEKNTVFDISDYHTYANLEIIRSASDYDDFYIASQTETENVLADVERFNKKIYDYVSELADGKIQI